jgi:hypothetical protein
MRSVRPLAEHVYRKSAGTGSYSSGKRSSRFVQRPHKPVSPAIANNGYPHLSFADKVGFVQLFNLLTDWTPDVAKMLLHNSTRYSASDAVA